MKFYTHIILIVLSPLILLGCGVHYYDKKSGTEHLWGIGHMKMKITAPSEGLQSVVHGRNLFGFSIGRYNQQYHLTLGLDMDNRIEIIDANTKLRIEKDSWPNNSLFNYRIGSEFPAIHNTEKDNKAEEDNHED